MGILSEELEETLNDTFRNAHVRRNEFVTVEHLLLGFSFGEIWTAPGICIRL